MLTSDAVRESLVDEVTWEMVDLPLPVSKGIRIVGSPYREMTRPNGRGREVVADIRARGVLIVVGFEE